MLSSSESDANKQCKQNAEELQLLVTQLLPLLTSELKTCGCKCEKKLSTLQQHYDRLMKVVKGYKEQVDIWKGKVRTLQSDFNTANAERQKEARQMKISANKIEQFTATHSSMKNSLQQQKTQVEEIKQLKTSLAMKTKEFDPTEIENSQKFINEEFEKLREENRVIKQQVATEKSNLQNQIQEVAQELEYNVKNTTRQRQYTREECLTVNGIPEPIESTDTSGNSDAAPKSDCIESKQAIVDLCKELNFVVDPDKISIAHRLKKGRYSKGPRPIIVKFTSKELCREVYDLRKTCREITEWAFDSRAGKIFINESLTPEKRKLLYDTKQAVNKQLYETHGIIYVWTHRGDVYVRKNTNGAPKIRVDSQLELQRLVQGRISLDVASNTRSVPNLIRWKYVKNPWSLGNDFRSHPIHTPTNAHRLSFQVEPNESY